MDDEYAPIPSLLALSAVHNHLIREKTRNQVALIVESGEPREVMHFCAAARLRRERRESLSGDRDARRPAPRTAHFPPEYTWDKVFKSYMKAIDKGLLKTFSKMGISTLQSYQGAQIFEAVGLEQVAGGALFHRHVLAHRGRGHGSAGARSADEARIRHAAAAANRKPNCASAANINTACAASGTC